MSAFSGLSREVLLSQWYSLHLAETGMWQVRTGPVSEHPLGFVIAEIELQTIADHIVAVHNRWYRGYQTYGED